MVPTEDRNKCNFGSVQFSFSFRAIFTADCADLLGIKETIVLTKGEKIDFSLPENGFLRPVGLQIMLMFSYPKCNGASISDCELADSVH